MPNTNGNGLRKTDTNWFKVGLLLSGIIVGVFGGIGGVQSFSPTNAHVQQELAVLKSEFNSYKQMREKEIILKDKMIDNRLKVITESIFEIKELLRENKK